MKRQLLIMLACFALAFASCKKELHINVDKTFVEQGKSGGSLGFGGIILELSPNGKAGILYGGDIVYSGVYQIKGDKLIVTEGNNRNEFKIISETELRYKDNRTLKLSQN